MQIYNKLRTVEHMTVYEKEAIPSRFYYKKGKFVSPLTLVADEGWFITEVIIKYVTIYLLEKVYQTAKDKYLLRFYTLKILFSYKCHLLHCFLLWRIKRLGQVTFRHTL